MQKSHTQRQTQSNSWIGVCTCACGNLLFSCPQIIWFTTHFSPYYEPFYYSFQWNRFNLYGHEQAAWLQLLFLIKGIDSGIIWSCLVNNWLRMAKPCCVGLHEIQYLRHFGSALCPRPCSSIQNAICLQSGLTPLFTAWQCQHTAHGNPRQRQALAGSVRTQSTGWIEAFHWWKACSVCRTYSNGFSERMEKAI